MPLKLPADGLLWTLDRLTGNFAAFGLILRLYQNDKTPADGDVVGDYTEADFSGYASHSIDNWQAAITAGVHSMSMADPVTFMHNGGPTGNSIYGIYVTDTSGTRLVYAERDPLAPASLTLAGQTYTYVPIFTLKSEF